MIRRALFHTLLAFSLVLSGLTAVVADTRMAASGDYCGTGAPQLLLDASGLPLLDDDGIAIAAPECPSCHLTLAVLAPKPRIPTARTILLVQAEPLAATSLSLLTSQLGGQARAPPRMA